MKEHPKDRDVDASAPKVRGKSDAAHDSGTTRVGRVQRVQRLAGNRAAAAAFGADAGVAVQRHPAGAPTLAGAVAAEPALTQPGRAPAANRGRSASAPAAVGGGGGGGAVAAPVGPAVAPTGPAVAPTGPAAAPTGPVAAPTGPEVAPTGPVAAPTGPVEAGGGAAGPGAAPTGPVAAPTAAAPVPVLGPTLQVAFSQQALQAAFGGAAGKNIIPGTITVVNGHAEVGVAYDTWCIAHNVHNDYFNRAWQMGDMVAQDDATGMRINAFAEPHPSTKIVVDGTTTDPTATVHEMLHINTHPDFRAAVGEVINEGVTQRLAVTAVRATGNSVAGSEFTYTREQEFVDKLVAVVGEPAILNGYFQGPDNLVRVADTLLGPGIFAVAKGALATSPPAYDAAEPLMAAQSPAQKTAAITRLLKSGMPTDADLHTIDLIVRGIDVGDREAVRKAVAPFLAGGFFKTLMRKNFPAATKARLRSILGMPA